MELLRVGLDTLYVAYQGALPSSLLAQLHAAKRRAKASGAPEPINLNGIRGMVAENGSKGGYSFLFDTGPHLETWKIKDNADVSQWNIFVEVRAVQCASMGFAGVVGRLDHVLRVIGASIITESVNRIDFAADFIAPDYQPDIDGLVCHSHCGVSEHAGLTSDDVPDIRRRNRKIETVTVGQQPGRQICVYNKRKEVVYGRRAHWLELWGYDDFKDLPEIWRVEIRAGKKHLSDWNITTFDDVRERIADLLATALQKVRFAIASNDQTVTRWADSDLWKAARAAFMSLDFDLSGAVQGRVIAAVRSEYVEAMRKQIIGGLGSFVFAAGMDFREVAGQVARAFLPDDPDAESWVVKRLARSADKAARRLYWMEDENYGCA
jgi:hypothetical protein